MDLNATYMFVNAVKSGSLSKAAEQMDIPLPTLSRRIRQLEKALKVQLLERSVRGIQLTDAGMRLYEHASRGLELLDQGEEAVKSDQAQLKGRLRVSLPPSFEPWWSLLEVFQKKYPLIRLSVFSTERKVDLIHDGIDVALRVGAIVDESMVARRLLAYRHLLVASPALIAKYGKPTKVDDLHRYPCAVWTKALNTTTVWRLGEYHFEPEYVMSTNDYIQLRQKVLSGDVISELPPFLAHQFLDQGLLCTIMEEHPLPEQTINLLYPSHKHPSSIVRTYLDFCQEYIVNHPLC